MNRNLATYYSISKKSKKGEGVSSFLSTRAFSCCFLFQSWRNRKLLTSPNLWQEKVQRPVLAPANWLLASILAVSHSLGAKESHADEAGDSLNNALTTGTQ